MAAAEARAAWQRTVNRCFVQEDAKRAPKLACCPSGSASAKHVDSEPVNLTDGQNDSSVGFMPLNRNPSHSNLPPESRWWLQMQSNHGFPKKLTNEQLSTLEEEMQTFVADGLDSTSKAIEVNQQHNGHSKPSFDTCSRSAAIYMKKDPEVEQKELNTVYAKSAQKPLKLDSLAESYEFLEIDPVGCSNQTSKNSFDSDFPWIEGEKAEPWWRVADGNELVSIVAQRSLDLIENCDLPQPQNTHVKGDPYAYLGYLDRKEILPPFKDLKAPMSSPTVETPGGLSLGSACEKMWASSGEQSRSRSDKQNSDGPPLQGTTETQNPDMDPSKAQLLEALCHSQTRAREAERAAKEAYAEKEHILKLFFRQASHLFAYKQWFQLLQLENLYLQIKNTNEPISTLFPVALPWIPTKPRKLQKNRQKTAKGKQRKRGRSRNENSKLSVVFALGLGLVGAGLLLGWTIGWMLPAF